MLKLLVLAFVGYVAAQGEADSRCPVPDPVPSLRLPHDTDCTRHWLCQNGLRHLMPACATGSNFDSVTLACRPVADAVCGPLPTTEPPTTEPETTEPTTTEPETTEPPTTEPETTEPPTTEPETTEPETTEEVPSTAPPANPTVSQVPPTVPTVARFMEGR